MTNPSVQPFDPATVPLTPGVTLIEASAGTGKTFAISRLVLRLLLQPEPIALREIAVVTFTEKGSDELVTRIRNTLRTARNLCTVPGAQPSKSDRDLVPLLDTHGDVAAARLESACSELDQLGVSTIHAFCLRILTEQALEAGVHFDAAFLDNDTEIFTRAAHDWARRTLVRDAESAKMVAAQQGNPTDWVRAIVRPLISHPSYMIADGSSPLLSNYVQSVLKGAARERARRHLLTFDESLSRLYRVLQRDGANGPLATRIRQRFRAALIDEFQDTDAFQFPIFKTAFEGRPLFLIGDPKQSIYAFRGADVRAYLSATSSAPRRFTLGLNYRSTPGMVQAVNALFSNHPSPFGEHLGITFTPVESADRATMPAALTDGSDDTRFLHWLLLPSGAKEISKTAALPMAIGATVTEILTLIERDLPARNIAILVHTNEEARKMKAALDAARVPAVVTSNRDVLISDEGDEIIRLALAIAEPGNERLVRGALATRCWGASAAEIAQLLQGDGGRAWGDIVRQFREAHDRWLQSGLASALALLLTACDATPRLGALPDGERRLTNLRHLLDLLREEGTGASLPPTAFRAWLARERQLSAVPERREQRLESDAAAVQILTIHKAKGLQWPVVFCPTLWSHTDHTSKVMGVNYAVATSPRAGDATDTVRCVDIGSPSVDETKQRAKQDADDEQMRLTYVALTRAESRCYVIWGRINKCAETALATLVGDDGSITALRQLIDAHPEAMSEAPAHDDTKSGLIPSHLGDAAQVQVTRGARAFSASAAQFAAWRTSSYSRLITKRHDGIATRDVEEETLSPVAASTELATGIFAIPKGTQIGNTLHNLLEHLDFTTAASVTTLEKALPLERIESELNRQGVPRAEPALWSATDIQRVIRDTCCATIPGTSFRFADVPMSRTLREWRFTIPVGNCNVQAVADALADHGTRHAQAYAERLRRLEVERFRGYLDGIVDLAFEHEGRWWIVDWKSNHLGDRASDYHSAAVEESMQSSDYTLQYHLYMVALHRHLKARLPKYDPAAHWGGIAYVYLRGVTPEGTTGWFRDMPSPALIEALDRALQPDTRPARSGAR